MHRYALVSVAALAILAGRVTDRTTGQPLSGVTVHLTGTANARAVTDRSGRFRTGPIPSGNYNVTFQSSDVPAQHRHARVGSGTTELDVKLCSTTLDYSCSNPVAPGAGPGGGAG